MIQPATGVHRPASCCLGTFAELVGQQEEAQPGSELTAGKPQRATLQGALLQLDRKFPAAENRLAATTSCQQQTTRNQAEVGQCSALTQ